MRRPQPAPAHETLYRNEQIVGLAGTREQRLIGAKPGALRPRGKALHAPEPRLGRGGEGGGMAERPRVVGEFSAAHSNLSAHGEEHIGNIISYHKRKFRILS